MEWKKNGLIFTSNGKYFWNKSHAQVPVAHYFKTKNFIRIFYSSRDIQSRSYVSFIDVDHQDPTKILYVHDTPILFPGKIGCFDDCGVMPSWIIEIDNKYFLYYIGWNIRNTVPYYNSIGLAISNDGVSFNRFSDGPLFDRNFKEPYFSASTCILIEDKIWKMWYLSCTGYYEVLGKIEPRYHIKYAESINGIDWIREGVVCIDYKIDDEAGIVKASVLKIDNIYYMWYSFRNFKNYRTDILNSYKIGFAKSNDGIIWTRFDENVGITLSEEGWDSEMLAYPHVVKSNHSLMMFYNGNNFGKEGFGVAVSKNLI